MGSATNTIGVAMNIMTNGTAASGVSNAAGLDANKGKVSFSFDTILNQVSDISVQANKTDVSNTKPVVNNKTDVSKQDTKVNVANNETVTDRNVTNADKANVAGETGGKEAGKELQEAIAEEGKKLISEIADELEVSEEDIVNAMQVLGITAADLFNPENLTQVVATVNGGEQAVDLITDSDLYSSLQDLMEDADGMRSELMNELGLTEKDFDSVVGQMHEEFSQVAENVSETDAEPVIEIDDQRDNRDLEKILTKDIHEETVERADVFEDEFKPVENSKDTTKYNQSGNLNHGSEGATVFNQFLNGVTDAINNTSGAEEMLRYTDRAQMENIVRQITEKITVSAANDETTLELQLHPASLGNVNILLTSGKDGVVAKFTAQNEIVKEAVESQMTQLQQKFEQQGIRVNSIEVTVSSHAFEENLQQQGGSSENNNQASKGRKGLRRINLLDSEDGLIDENLDDAERISAQMMAMNGNTVDFSA